MKPLQHIVIATLLLALSGVDAAAQSSNAARYLVRERIALACGGNGGSFAPGGIIERDLTGDGRADLILADGFLTCRGPSSRSGFCGAALCEYTIYVRQGDLLQRIKTGLAVEGIEVGAGPVPVITTVSGPANGFRKVTTRWNGRGFE